MHIDTEQLLKNLLSNDSDLIPESEAVGHLEITGHRVQNWTVGGNPYRFDHLVAPLRDELAEAFGNVLVADAAIAYARIVWPRWRACVGYDGTIDAWASARSWLYRTASAIVQLVEDARRTEEVAS